MRLISPQSSDHVKNDGESIVIRLPEGMKSKSPIELSLDPSKSDKQVNLQILAGKGAVATVVIRLEGTPGLKTLDFRLTIKAEEHSHLRMVEFQNLPPATRFSARRESEAKEGAELEHIMIDLGAHTVDGTLSQTAAGYGVKLDSSILLISKKSQRKRFKLNNFFTQQKGSGHVALKSIAQDEGVIETLGTLKVGRQGTGTETALRMDSLLLSRKAKISATPALEIDTNDVKVGHAASVSNLNEENLFYLTSRGINTDEAKRLMVKGFVAEVTDKLIELEGLKEEIMKLI